LLGILDKGTLTIGDNRKVDFSRTVLVMTSNLGAEQMSRLARGGIGFTASAPEDSVRQTDKRMESVALAATKQYFSPEFMNRLDRVVVFHGLSPNQLTEILENRTRTGSGQNRSTAPGSWVQIQLHSGNESISDP
jgi:ATP-dependent Clp protease ATP-binding subunit ClpB